MGIGHRTLGESNLSVGRIGISTSFGADRRVFHQAFERGCNYFTWGTFIKGRSSEFVSFVHDINAAGKRSDLVIGLLSYSHLVSLGSFFLKNALQKLGTDYIDALILGYYSKPPPPRILEWTLKLKERGIIRAIGVTTHNRALVGTLIGDMAPIDFFHVRYNAVHRGAEQDIFPLVEEAARKVGLVSFTATCWGKLLKAKKLPPGMDPLSAGDCYRFVLSNEAVDVCMMGVRDLSMLEENLSEINKGVPSATEMARFSEVGQQLYRP